MNPAENRFKYQAAFCQTVHLTTLTGIARAATLDVSQRVANRTRTLTHATARISRQDPQVLEVVGSVHAAACAAGAITQRVARALQRAYEATANDDDELVRRASLSAEIEAAEAQITVRRLIQDSINRLFDALAASATSASAALDRHWRNARTISSHNLSSTRNA